MLVLVPADWVDSSARVTLADLVELDREPLTFAAPHLDEAGTARAAFDDVTFAVPAVPYTTGGWYIAALGSTDAASDLLWYGQFAAPLEVSDALLVASPLSGAVVLS